MVEIINNKNGFKSIHSIEDFKMLKHMLPEYCSYRFI